MPRTPREKLGAEGEPPEVGVDELFQVGLEEFIRRRDALAKQLEQEGRGEEAAGVRRLRKPSAAAWALNQVSRRHPKKVEWLLAAHQKLGMAQTPAALKEASASRQRMVAELVEDALGLLETEGRSPSQTVRQRITRSLLSLATDEEAQEEFQRGRLVRDLEPGGWGPAIGLAPSTSQPQGRKQPEVDRARREAGQAAEKASRLSTRAAAAQERLGDAEREAARAMEAAREAQEQAKQKEREVRRLERRLRRTSQKE
ncbi:MAG: hypothetical protein ACRDXD_06015 [Acidimicrobiia bacterium]